MIYLQSILALCFVVSLILALYIVFQRLEGRIPGVRTKRIKVIESVSLGDKRRLLLVQVENQCLLVGTTGQHISLLSSMESVEESVRVELPHDSTTQEGETLQPEFGRAR